MKSVLVTLENGKKSIVDIPDELTQQEAIDQIEASAPAKIVDMVLVPSASDKITSDTIAKQVDDGEIPSDVIATQAAEFIPGTETFEAKAKADEETRIRKAREEKNINFEAFWDKSNVEEKSKYLSDITGNSYGDSYEEVISYPNRALTTAKSYYFKGEAPSTVKSRYSAAKDIFSGPGRAISAGMDQLFSPTNASSENFIESFSRLGSSVPEGEEERSLFGNLATGAIKDPFLAPSMAIPTKAAGKVTDLLLGGMKRTLPGRIARGATTGLIQGAGETAAIEALESNLGGREFNPANIAMGSLFGTTLGGVGGGLRSRALRKFESQIPNAKSRNMNKFNLGEIKPEVERVFDKSTGVFNYNLPKQRAKVNKDLVNLGQQKENIITDFANRQNIGNTGAPGSIIENKIGEEINNIAGKVQTGRLTRNQAEDYLTAIQDFRNSSIVNPSDVSLSSNPTLERAITDLGGTPSTLEYRTDLTELFNSRKALDAEMQNVWKKLEKHRTPTEIENAYLFVRKTINDQIDHTIDNITTKVKERGIKEEIKAVNNLNKKLKKTGEMPNLYKERDIIESIGGGRSEKSSANMFNPATYLKMAFPVSGIRNKQVSDFISSPAGQLYIKNMIDPVITDEEQPLF